MVSELRNYSLFRVFAKNHVLFREKEPINRIYIIKEGWVRRTQSSSSIGGKEIEDFIGHGFCFGIEGAARDATWPYAVTLMGRTEVLEISVSKLRRNNALQDEVLKLIARHAPRRWALVTTNFVPDGLLAAQRGSSTPGL